MSSAICFYLDQSKILSSGNRFRQLLIDFTLSQTSPGFYVFAVQVSWKHLGKRRNYSKWVISPFPTVFSTHLENFLPLSSDMTLLSANSFSLDESKFCRLGKGWLFSTQSWLLTTLKKNAFDDIVGKGANAGNHHSLLFSQYFLLIL